MLLVASIIIDLVQIYLTIINYVCHEFIVEAEGQL